MQHLPQHILLCAILLLATCHHARVELPPIIDVAGTGQQTPSTGYSSIRKSEQDILTLKQDYYLWGLFPREFAYDEGSLCPGRGIRELHQFYAPRDFLLEQLTFGIYSPRTLEVRCY